MHFFLVQCILPLFFVSALINWTVWMVRGMRGEKIIILIKKKLTRLKMKTRWRTCDVCMYKYVCHAMALCMPKRTYVRPSSSSVSHLLSVFVIWYFTFLFPPLAFLYHNYSTHLKFYYFPSFCINSYFTTQCVH